MTDGADPFATTPAGGGGGVAHTVTVAGAAAGDLTVAGMTVGATIVSVVAVTKQTQKISWFAGSGSGGAAWDFTTTPITGASLLTTDIVDAVLLGNGGGTHIDYSANFPTSASQTNHIIQSGGGSSAGFDGWVIHHAVGTASADLASEFTAASGKINNTGGTSTLGKTVVVSWTAAT